MTCTYLVLARTVYEYLHGIVALCSYLWNVAMLLCTYTGL